MSATAAPTPSATASTSKPEPQSTPSAQPKPDPTPTKTRPAALLAPGDRGEKVRALQHRLRQLAWYSGSITGTYASATTKGVKGFQAKRKLPVGNRRNVLLPTLSL